MDSQGWPSIRTKILCDIIGNAFGANKDENFGVFGTNLIKVLNQFRPFFEVAADFNNLLNVVVGCEIHRSDIDLYHVLQKVLNIFVSVSAKLTPESALTLANF